jgi:hypothetical protein
MSPQHSSDCRPLLIHAPGDPKATASAGSVTDAISGGRSTYVYTRFLNFDEFARQLSVPEAWVRRNVRRTYTRDPIPHFSYGRKIRMLHVESPEVQAWIRRHMVGVTQPRSSSSTARSYNDASTESGPKRKERIQ